MCVWKNGKHVPCEKYANNYDLDVSGKTFSMRTGYVDWECCPYCGGTLKNEIVIKESGNTYIIEYKNKNWFVTHPYYNGSTTKMSKESIMEIFEDFSMCEPENPFGKELLIIKPVESVKLDDTTALLRPYVVVKDRGISKLIYADSDYAWTTGGNYLLKDVRLALVAEL